MGFLLFRIWRPAVSLAVDEVGCYHPTYPREVKRHMTAHLEFMRNKILWSDETKIELFGLNAKIHAWRKPITIPTVKHGGGRIMGLFFSCWDWETSQD